MVSPDDDGSGTSVSSDRDHSSDYDMLVENMRMLQIRIEGVFIT